MVFNSKVFDNQYWGKDPHQRKKSMTSNPRNIFPEISEALGRPCVPYLSSHSFPLRPLSHFDLQVLQENNTTRVLFEGK